LYQLGVPFIVERLFGPNYRLNLEFQFVMAGFANVPMGHVEIITSRNGGFDDTLANITGKGFHMYSLILFYWLMIVITIAAENQSSTGKILLLIQKKVEGGKSEKRKNRHKWY